MFDFTGWARQLNFNTLENERTHQSQHIFVLAGLSALQGFRHSFLLLLDDGSRNPPNYLMAPLDRPRC